MKESPQQIEAKVLLGKNILLSASAGAGKTTVLINRLMKRIVDDKVNVDQIIAMTFTELAAGEMKKRLSKRLYEAFSLNPDPRLYQQIALLPSSKISTIHSFCLTLIKDYAYVLGINTKRANSILDPANASVYKLQALTRVLDEFYQAQPDGFIELLNYFKSNPENDENLRSTILDLASKLDAKSNPIEWLNNAVLAYQNVLSINTLDKTYRDAFFEYLDYKVRLLEDAFISFKRSVLATEDNLERFKLDQFSNIIDSAKKAIKAKDYTQYLNNWDKLNECTYKSMSLKSTTTVSDRDIFFDALNSALSFCFKEERFIKDLNYIAKQVNVLKDMTLSYMKYYEDFKKIKEVLDFSDMEKMALTILKNEEFKISDYFKKTYKEVLIDEFQDTNDVQNEIINLISNGTNTFRVGDVKQSIYRFRNAKPQLMLDMMHNPSASDKVLYLSQNYRSSESIINFNNTLFNRLMNVDQSQSEYSDKDMVGCGKLENIGGLPVEIHLIRNGIEVDSTKEDNSN
ncbi:MAG: UvrD-helicase domain-containing protein, partial [Erysipelotrichaceae bacterium]